jgi:ribosomal protein L37E
MVWATCKNCGRESERHAKEMCVTCYKKLFWKPKKITCKRCNREMHSHAKGLCGGCYNFVFHIERIKSENHKKKHNIDIELYKKITKECVVCGFDKVVDLHHLDENRKNNSEDNLAGLCPNHHKMFHMAGYREEIVSTLREKGFNVPEKIGFNFVL